MIVSVESLEVGVVVLETPDTGVINVTASMPGAIVLIPSGPPGPKGDDGAQGIPGEDGPQGPQGPMPPLSSALPAAVASAGNAGVSTDAPRADHVHSGLTQADADTRYVNVAGDSMTGQLSVSPGISLTRAGNEPYITMTRDATVRAQIRGHITNGINITDSGGATEYLRIGPLFTLAGIPSIGGKVAYLNDSGNRSVTTGFTNGWTGQMYIRRVGNLVYLVMDGMTYGSSQGFFNLTAGFIPDGPIRGICGNSGSTAFKRIYLTAGSNVGVNGNTGDGAYYGSVIFPTIDAWPASYPGAAA